MKYALFLGCMIPLRLPNLEYATRNVLAEFGVELVDMREATCCPDPIGIRNMDYLTWLAIAARNLAVADEMGLDILTLCNGCYETLKTAYVTLTEDAEMREKINEILAKANREFKGKAKVKHLLEVFYHDIGLQKIREMVKRPLEGLKVAAHYGCHILRPSEILKFDDPENPRKLDELVEALGATPQQYEMKTLCCGAGLRNVMSEYSIRMAREKLVRVKEAGADCMVVACPFCFIQYDMGQFEIRRLTKERFDIPVFYFSELLGYAIGLSPRELGLGMHRVKVDRVLKKIR
ncbi:MAG: CoB--CoM heterodisulfide reductase subunit B [Candidatus Baldrarchaeia archaeon]